MTFFVSCYSLWLKVYFVWLKYSYPCFFLFSIHMECIFLPIHFQTVCFLNAKVNLCRQHGVGGCGGGSCIFIQPLCVHWRVFSISIYSNYWQVWTYYFHFVNCLLDVLYFICSNLFLLSSFWIWWFSADVWLVSLLLTFLCISGRLLLSVTRRLT